MTSREPITCAETMLFMTGDDTWEEFTDTVEVLGGDSRWWTGYKFLILLMGAGRGSSKKPEPSC